MLRGDMMLLSLPRALRKRLKAKSLLFSTSRFSSSVRLISLRGFSSGSPMYCPMKKMAPVLLSLMT